MKAADTSPGRVKVVYFNEVKCIHSFSSGVFVLENLGFLPSNKCLRKKLKKRWKRDRKVDRKLGMTPRPTEL